MSVHSATKPWWQQATALVTVSTGGMVTGFTFAPGAAATMTSPTGTPVHLMALEKAASSAHSGDTALSSDAALRSAIVNVAKYYLQLAKTRTPAQMEAMIWGKDSLDGADHGESCAAFASLTLELGAQAVGQQSWVSGGSSYPWPVHEWADSRVDPSPGSPRVTDMLTDAQAHGRWHALGDGYQPRPGDWVLFDQHVEVVTRYSGGVLDTIGADSLPGYTVNAHTFGGSLAEHGIAGFIDNGHLATAGDGASQRAAGGQSARGGQSAGDKEAARQGTATPGSAAQSQAQAQAQQGRHNAAAPPGSAAIPGAEATDVPGAVATAIPGAEATAIPGAEPPRGTAAAENRAQAQVASAAAIPGLVIPGGSGGHGDGSGESGGGSGAHGDSGESGRSGGSGAAAPTADSAVIPGLAPAGANAAASHSGSGRGSADAGSSGGHYTRHPAEPSSRTPGTKAQQAFISAVAPGAIAAQQRYGVPASVTIAQAIDESDWGNSTLATSDHNLFGIKGTGPAGSSDYRTQEFIDGQWETVTAGFRAYHNIAESISDHAELLATSGHYTRAMADRAVPDAFANDLTGVYATDPEYGSNLIATMKLYNLYRYDAMASSVSQQSSSASHAAPQHATAPGPALSPAAPSHAAPSSAATGAPTIAPAPAHGGGPAAPTASVPDVPGVTTPPPAPSGSPPPSAPSAQIPSFAGTPGYRTAPSARGAAARGDASIPGLVPAMIPAKTAARYTATLPPAVTTAFFTTAKTPLARGEQLYRDVASRVGISWKLLAACDWMQCQAHPRYSPVHGEKIGSVNRDGSVYATKSEALTQCAVDMLALARAVYGIDLTVPRPMSVRALAEVFAAFRWGGLLKKHGVSAMEFPYSVAGLTEYHTKMHWPAIHEPNAPDKPGGKFKRPFGAVPVVLSLKYPATV